jgi:hypothetical protein
MSFSKLNEWKARIVDFLPAKDVANLRLTSQAWAGVCVQGSFKASVGPCTKNGVFSIRPHLDDMTRIKEVSIRPCLAKHIKHLEIFVGDFNF